MKPILLIILSIFAQLQLADIIQERGQQLCMLQNMPHRGLGHLYVAHVLCPWRDDWTFDYIAEWTIVTKENRLAEGVTVPVMPFMAIREASKHPDNQQWQHLKGFCQQLERQRNQK